MVSFYHPPSVYISNKAETAVFKLLSFFCCSYFWEIILLLVLGFFVFNQKNNIMLSFYENKSHDDKLLVKIECYVNLYIF